MNNTQPLVSICCITYNHARYLECAINSFLMQETSFPIEIIVHDDCSTDGTTQIIRKYESASELIVPIIQTENQKSKGKKIFPIAFARAQGKYIAMCEGDDYWTDPTKLQKQVAFLEANPESVLCHHDAVVIDGDGKVLQESKLPDNLKRDLSADELTTTGGVLTLTACFRNVLGECPSEYFRVFNGDTFLFSMLGTFGSCKYMGNEITPAVYRRHAGGIWSHIDQWNAALHRTQTYYWLGRYYERSGSKKHASYFRQKYQKNLMGLMNAPENPHQLKRTWQEFVSRRENLTDIRFVARFMSRLMHEYL